MSTLSPTVRTKLRGIVEAFDAAIERERALWGATSAEKMRAKGLGLADINAGRDLERGISLRDVHALAERGLLQVETARTSATGLRRGSFGRWLGGSVPHELVTARVSPTEEARRQITATEVAVMPDQLWVVFLDGVAQAGVLPYAGSEEMALSLWRAQTGGDGIARARLRAVPKDEDRAATALTIVRDIAHQLRDEDEAINGGDFIDDVYGVLDDAGFIDEARARRRPRYRQIPTKSPALAIVQNIALEFRDPDADVNGGDFLDYVTRMLDQAGFLADSQLGGDTARGGGLAGEGRREEQQE